MKTKVYIAGRITGNAGYKEEFAAARAFYERQGFTVLDPSAMPEGMEWADYARICAAMIDSADAVVLLPDWEMSPGARLEKAYAEYIRRGVIYHEEMIDERAEREAVRERRAECGERREKKDRPADDKAKVKAESDALAAGSAFDKVAESVARLIAECFSQLDGF